MTHEEVQQLVTHGEVQQLVTQILADSEKDRTLCYNNFMDPCPELIVIRDYSTRGGKSIANAFSQGYGMSFDTFYVVFMVTMFGASVR